MVDTNARGNETARSGQEQLPPVVGLRILLVEDHADTAKTLAAILRLHGHEVRLASDGPSALHVAETEPLDIVLLDIGLPGMDGYQVAERLRQQGTKKRPLLIALTGYGHKQDRLHSYQVGFDLHLTKPISGEEVQHFLEHYQKVTAKAKR